MVATKPMTAEEFMALPDDGWRYELIRGVPIRMSPAGLEHGGIGTRVLVALEMFVDARGLGLVVGADTGYLFERDPDVVRAPDVSFVRADRLPARDQWRGYSTVLPDLAVEVVSPNDRPAEIAEKVAYYLDHGIPLVWVVYPTTRQVAVHRPGQPPELLGLGDTLEGDGILAGFRLPVADIFR